VEAFEKHADAQHKLIKHFIENVIDIPATVPGPVQKAVRDCAVKCLDKIIQDLKAQVLSPDL
jgi:phosphoribosyl-dephospho-CoA transferase